MPDRDNDAADALAYAVSASGRTVEIRRALEEFKVRFPDIIDNKALFKLADDLTIELKKNNPKWSDREVMLESGARIRAKYGKSQNPYISGGISGGLGGLGNFGQADQSARMQQQAVHSYNAQQQQRLGATDWQSRYEQKWKQEQFEMERAHRKRGLQQGRGGGKSMARQDRNQRILSRPVPVHWAGWETDTLRLQRAGWQLAVEFEPTRDMYSLMLKHPEMNMMALTSAIRLDHGLSMLDNYRSRGYSDPATGVNATVPFNVVKVAPQFENVRIQSTGTWKNFQLIDAEPQMVDTIIERPEDLNIFALAMTQAEQVAIDQADMSVVEHLEAIKDLQSDEQKMLRDKARKREARIDGENAVTGEVIVQLVDYKH